MGEVNIWAVLVSAVASMVIGGTWFGPLFGKQYMHAIGMDTWSAEKQAAEKKKMGMSYFGQFIASLVMFYILAWFIGGLDRLTLQGGMVIGFLVWLGFVVPTKFGDAIWGGKMSLFWLTTGNSLVTLLATGAIIGAWK